MTEKLLKATLNPKQQQQKFSYKTLQFSTKTKRANIATENHFLHFELHAFYGDVLTLKNAEIRGKVLFKSTAEYRF